MSPTFSQRLGLKPTRVALQVESMDDDLRVALWNAAHELYLGGLTERTFPTEAEGILLTRLWRDHIKEPLDTIGYAPVAFKRLKEDFFDSSWNEAYDFIESLVVAGAHMCPDGTSRKYLNQILEREAAGYRFIGKTIGPITSPIELAAIDDAMELARNHRLTGATIHLQSAIRLFSDRSKPDYRNSVKESISAVEATACLIVGTPGASLGDALKMLSSKAHLHGALTKGFQSIYGYTSDHGGIRHGLLDDGQTVDAADSKYMLVSCSAFVHYIVQKAVDVGLLS